MSSIAGFTGVNGNSITPMLKQLAHWEPDRQGNYFDTNISLAALELFNSSQSKFTPQPFKFKQYVIVADCRIDNRAQLGSLLDVRDVDAIADINYIAFAYEKWGSQCVNYLYGDFAFVIWDTNEKKLFGARDHIGIKTLYYSFIDDEFVFSSEIKGITAYPAFKPASNLEYFIRNFSLTEISVTDTPYANISQIKNGCYFTWHAGQLNIQQYWEPGCHKIEVPADLPTQLIKFNELLFEAVNCRLRTDGNVGAEVSGGLDSTGIAGVAMEILGKGSPFYSYCYGQPEKKATDHFPVDDVPIVEDFCTNYQIEKYLSVVNEQDIPLAEHLDVMENVYDDYEQNGVPTVTVAFLPKAKSSHVKVMLSGHGGDHVVTSRSYGFYMSNARNKKYKTLWKNLRVRFNRFGTLPRFVYYIGKTINRKGFFDKQIKKNRDCLNQVGLKQSIAKLHGIYDMPSAYYQLNKHDNIWDKYVSSLKYADLQMRAYHHELLGKHYNIEYRFPLLDVRLIEYVMSLPRETVAPGDKMRYLFTKAVGPYVPQKVISIQKSSVATTPFMKAYFYQHRAEIEDRLTAELSNSEFSHFFDSIDFKVLKTKLILKLLNLTYIYNKTKNQKINAD